MGAEKRRDTKGRILRDNEFQRPDGQYMYRYYDFNGNMKYVYSWKLVDTDTIPKGKRQCDSLRAKEAQIAKDKHNGLDTAKAKKVTLNDIFDKYIEGKTELKASTRGNYLYMYDNYVRDNIGNRKIADIKYSDIKSFYNSLINEKGFKPNSMEIIHTILHPTFTMAVRDDIINKNPTDAVMSEIKKSHNWEKGKRHALTIEQQTAFINFISKSDIYSHWLNLFTAFLGTGCRVGELIGLRWKDCDFKNRTISINHNLIYRQHENGKCLFNITTPKTESGKRTIPMLNDVYNALNQERMYQMKNGWCIDEIPDENGKLYSGFVFTNRDRGVISPHSINRAIKRIYTAYNEQEQEQAKRERREPILIPHFSVHNLRHTFCTRFCENETNVKVIQEIMGHADISTTMNVYAEATESKKKEVFNALEGKIKIC